MSAWIADTGPLVALLVGDDQWHEWALEKSRQAPDAISTCEAVITETLFLLKRDRHPTDNLFAMVETGFLRCEFDFQREHRRVRELMGRYRAQPMSLADACLVRMAEMHPSACVWTLDRHFQIYRQHGRSTLALVAPW